MHQQRNLLTNLSKEKKETIELLRALLAKADQRRAAMKTILERGGGRADQIAISRLSAILVFEGFNIAAPGHPFASQDERNILAILSRAQLSVTKSASAKPTHDAFECLSVVPQSDLEASAHALLRIGIQLPTECQT
ncbi:MAG: hypothetical protein WCY92_01185 [Novosphingobium sp.]|uniref:hypothetical protein n=1 Tax=Sphingobium yanoikuyae TaxID=13690 RepID=UPI0008471FB1|nr:hypothetical protein [Sphingobium yanoikuyae]